MLPVTDHRDSAHHHSVTAACRHVGTGRARTAGCLDI